MSSLSSPASRSRSSPGLNSSGSVDNNGGSSSSSSMLNPMARTFVPSIQGHRKTAASSSGDASLPNEDASRAVNPNQEARATSKEVETNPSSPFRHGHGNTAGFTTGPSSVPLGVGNASSRRTKPPNATSKEEATVASSPPLQGRWKGASRSSNISVPNAGIWRRVNEAPEAMVKPSPQGQPRNAGSTSAQASPSVPKSENHLDVQEPAKPASKVWYDQIARPVPRTSTRPRRYRKQAYDKDLFLQANFRFLVSDFGDYVENTVDPDKMVDWEDIAAVELLSTATLQCPICLDERPLCPQITACGHVFCFPCILRYLMMEPAGGNKQAEQWKKCPLCFTMVGSKDLRSVFIHPVKRYQPGDDIEFTLLTRAKGFVIPLHGNESGWALACTVDGQCDLFSKFTLTSDIEKMTDRDVNELTSWAQAAEHGGGTEEHERLPYVLASIEELQNRKRLWDEHRAEELLSSSPPLKTIGGLGKPSRNPKSEPKSEPVKREPQYRLNGFTDELELVQTEADKVETPADEDGAGAGAGPDRPEESYTFYQAADGQLIILHPFNMKCITRHYGGYKNLPLKLKGKVCEFETVVQTEASRRRYRYLSHFPLTSTVQLCEIDISKSLPSSAVAPFAEELRNREKRRKQKAKKEKQLKDAEDRREAAARPPSSADFAAMLGVLHDQNVPTYSDFTNDMIPEVPISVSPPVEGRKLFSSVTRMGYAAGHDAPDLITASSSNAPSTSTPSPSTSARSSWKAATGSGLSFADVIQQKEKETIQASTEQATSKKGKKATRILLSTAGRRY